SYFVLSACCSRGFLRFGSLRRGFPALRRLSAVLLREAFDAAFRIEQLLLAREERVAARADLEVQLGLGRMRLPGRPARAPRFDLEILGVDGFLHSDLLGQSAKL